MQASLGLPEMGGGDLYDPSPEPEAETLADISPNVFDRAQDAILHLMSTHSFPSFLSR